MTFSDLAINYYVASSSGWYKRNVQSDHRVRSRPSRIGKAKNSVAFAIQILATRPTSCLSIINIECCHVYGGSRSRYLPINSGASNKDVRLDCIFHRRQYIEEAIEAFSKKVFSGEYLTVYEIDYDLATTTAKRNQNGS